MKQKKWMAVVLIAAMLVSIMPAGAFAANKDYTIVTENGKKTYQVYTAEGLYAWNAAAQADLSINLELMANITLPDKDITSGSAITIDNNNNKPSGSNWTPVGGVYDHSAFTRTVYEGVINGNGHTISGMRICFEESKYAPDIAFVGTLGKNAVIENLTLHNAVIYYKGSSTAAVLAGTNFGYIKNCHVTGDSHVYGNGNDTGGIAGDNQNASGGKGYIIACSNMAEVNGTGSVGGIAGVSNGMVIGSWTKETQEADPGSDIWAKDGIGRKYNTDTAVYSFSSTADATSEKITAMNNALRGAKYSYSWINSSDSWPTVANGSCNTFTYTASGNVITETCTHNGTETATITSPSSPVYDGNPKEASVTYSDTWHGGDLTISYHSDITQAGTVTASIQKDSAAASVNYTIAPATLTIHNVMVKEKDYDGTTAAEVESITFSGVIGSDTLTLNTDYTVTANFDSAEAGNNKNVTVTVTLINNNYKLDSNTITAAASIRGTSIPTTPTIPSTGSSSSSGGFSGKYNYPVTVSTSEYCEVTLSDDYAVEGETVTISITPDAGRAVQAVIVTDKDGKTIPVVKTGKNQYQFTMPEGKVNIDVQTEPSPYTDTIILQIGSYEAMVNKMEIRTDAAPFIHDNRTMVPIRLIVEALGGLARWDADTRTVTLTMDGKVLTMVIGQMIPGFDTAAIIVDGRTYVPIRYVAEAIGCDVEWVADMQQVIIRK